MTKNQQEQESYAYSIETPFWELIYSSKFMLLWRSLSLYQANLYCRRKFLVSRPLVFTFWNKLYLDMISKCWQKKYWDRIYRASFSKVAFSQCNFQLECHLLAIDVTKMQILIYHVITNLFLFLKLRGYSHDCSCGRRRNTCKHALSNYDISVIGS